jgi:xylulokinase
VDIGTTGSKGVLVDLDGNVVAHKGLEHSTDSPRPGWYEQDADQVWWGDLKKIIRGLIAESGVEGSAIAGVGISALSPEMLPVDEGGRPLRKGILYSDGRARKQIEQLVRQFSGGDIFHVETTSLSTHSVGPKILWFRENEPALFERTRVIHTATSYLVFKLTGASLINFVEAYGFNPFFDAQQLKWDQDVCRALDLSTDLFPEARLWATDLAGEVTAEAARETGLAEGTPVIVGTCDAFAEGLSVGTVEVGEANILYGTTMIFGLTLGGPQTASGAPGIPGPLPNTFRTGLAMSASGALTTWFRDNFGQMEQEAEEKLGISAYQLLSEQAAEIPPGSEGLVILPYFAGERSPIHDGLARGMVLGLTLSHTRKHIYRALLEAVAYSLRHSLEAMGDTGVEIQRIVSTGGGAKSALWTQIVGDVIGQDQEVILNPFGAPYGDAFMAGYGAGIFKDLSPFREGWAPKTRKVRYNPETKKVYDQYYEVYRGLYEINKDSMHTLARLSMSGGELTP